MAKKIFFRPKTGVCADFIPFYDQGLFRLYFLRDYRDHENHGEGTPWQLTETRDFVSFTEETDILTRGTIDEQDLYCFTGCVYKLDGTYHIYYTGHNPHLRKKGLPEQAVMHAVSKDGKKFEKMPQHTFFAPEELYEKHDWRDPFIYYDDKEKKYTMLLAARNLKGAATRKGCTAGCTSDDLIKWKVTGNILDPEAFFTHECPDYFEINEWKYIIFSEFSDRCVTRYKMSRDGKNWVTPKIDSFDGRAYYAAKSATDGKRRYLFGWIPTKNKTDHDAWNWGGDLAVHEIYQGPKGILYARMPQSLYESFNHNILDVREIAFGNPNKDEMHLLDLIESKTFMLEFDLWVSDKVTEAGVLLNYDTENDTGYTCAVNLQNNMLQFNAYPNQPWNFSNFVNVNRPTERQKMYHFAILVEDNIAVTYVDGKFALSSRMYPGDNHKVHGLIAKNGEIRITNLKAMIRK